MRKGEKFKTEEIIAVLRQVEIIINQGKTVPMACREADILEQTYYRWRKLYGGMQISQAKEFKKLQEENARLKRAVADLTLDKLILNEALSGKY